MDGPDAVVVVRLPLPIGPLSVQMTDLHLLESASYQDLLLFYLEAMQAGLDLLVPSVTTQVPRYLHRHLVAIAVMLFQSFGHGLLVGTWLSLSLSNRALRFRQSCGYRQYPSLRLENHQTGDQGFPRQDRDRTRGLPQSVAVGRMIVTHPRGILSGRICLMPSHICWLDQILIGVSISDECRDSAMMENVKTSFVVRKNDKGWMV